MNTLFQFQNISWREPLWLLIAFQPLLLLLIRKFIQQKKTTLFADKKLQPWVNVPSKGVFTNSLLSKDTAYLIAWLLFSIALAGPRWPISHQNKNNLFGTDIMIVVDHSKSMQARDIAPNRLRRAKLEIYELIEKAYNHRIGISVFSGRPHLFVPLTSDHNALKSYLETLEKIPFPTQGSNPIEALTFASNELLSSKNKSSIVLITDGDFTPFTDSQLQRIYKRTIPVYILGIGTIEGEAIQSKNGTWLRHNQKHVVSKMDEDNLIKLSRYTKGKYSPVYDDSSDWEVIFDQGITLNNQSSQNDGDNQIIWNELFPYFLLPSVLFFLLSLNTFKFKSNKVTSIILASAFIFSYPEENIYAIELGQTMEQSAYRAYKKEKYNDAAVLYQNIQGYSSYIGYANSLYRQGHYQKSIPQFSIAVTSAKNNKQRHIALYNLANSYFRTGQFSLAIATYEDVLRYLPTHKPSTHNLNVSKILKKNIELRLNNMKQNITSSRQGRGPNTAPASNDNLINENTSVSVSDNNTFGQEEVPLPDLPNIDNDSLKKLILMGLKNIKLAEQDSVDYNEATLEVNISERQYKAKQYLQTITDSQNVLWKRLFELEEGFPAPVETPKTIPGVKPW